MTRAALFLALIALALPAGAAAHATLTGTSPENGAVLDTAPAAVVVTFDDTVRVAPGNAAVANATNESVLAGPATAHAHDLRIPLRHNLANGAYSVRWSIVSDDGHRERGVLAFAVGAGSASPHSVLGAGTTLTWNDILLRTLYYLGVLAAGGAAVFGLRARTLFGEGLRRPLAHLLFFSLLLFFLGGSGILHSAPPGTRFALVVKIAITVALAGGAAAALAPAVPRLLPVALAASLLLLAAPTLSGHALDRNQPRVLAAVIDLAHISAAAVWFGGLLALVYVVPRASTDDGTRRAGARAFSSSALVAVLVLAASGLGRALTELSAVSQMWSTSYGRALIVKTALFLPLLGVGWLNRTLLLDVFARLRRSVLVEITVITGIVVAVAVLTELRPGRDTAKALAASIAAPQPPPVPPRDAVVDARELGTLAVGVAREPGHATVTLLGPDNTGVSRGVTIDGARAANCGPGCYRASARAGPLRVTVSGRPLVFTIPASAPDAGTTLAALTKNFRNARTIVFRESLASSPANRQLTRFTVVAPHRLAYAIVNGPAAVVIGAKRWDKDSAKAQWILSQQTPLDVTQPYWRATTNVHTVAPGVITFFDPRLPAWFRVHYAGRYPTMTRMSAAAHFMVDRYAGFDVPAGVSPPR
ncbi:MAG TPA: copper resistance protein CopC [Gaiellaceae bacterium]|nr:copper resistance protein CopC [Gaiellaceae bacterium]